MTTTLTFSVPEHDAREFSGLPAEARTRVHWFLAVFRSIAAAGAKTKACAAVAEAAEIHFNTVYNTWKAFARTGDWRVCLDKRKTPEFWKRDTSKAIGLPHEFTEFWKGLCEENQRAFKPAHRLLRLQYRRWRNGDQTQAVPGYSFCPPPAPGSSLPRGWNYSNLLHHVPNEIELAAARGGRTAALKLMPGVLTTRIGSYPFAEVQFDDMWHDFEVNVPGQKSACRLLEFGAVDPFTTFLFRPGLKPRLRNMDTGKAQVLNSRDFHLYLVNWLLDFGAHPDGTVLMMENGTAAVSKEFREKLMSWLPQLTIETGGMSGAPAFAGAWRERGKGNPNAKSLKEGLGKLIHNQLAHLPGQIGMNRENLPAGHFGMSRENDTLLAIAAQLPALTNQIQLGLLSFDDAAFAIHEIYNLLNCRDDHKIEGWAQIGGVVDSFCFSKHSDIWMGMEEMDRLEPHEREMFRLAVKLDPSLRKPRVLSPAEMLLAHSPRLIKPPHESIPDLLGAAYGETKAVTNGIITIRRPDIAGGIARFHGTYQDADGYRRRLPNGEGVLCHLNPWKPDHLYLSEPRTGRFLGLADRQHAATRGDTDAIQAQHARAQHDYKESLHGLVQRQGLARVPNLKANTATFRKASAPTARDRAVADSFDSSELLESESGGDLRSPTYEDPAITFDPADLL